MVTILQGMEWIRYISIAQDCLCISTFMQLITLSTTRGWTKDGRDEQIFSQVGRGIEPGLKIGGKWSLQKKKNVCLQYNEHFLLKLS